jgi:hypothetical protein
MLKMSSQSRDGKLIGFVFAVISGTNIVVRLLVRFSTKKGLAERSGQVKATATKYRTTCHTNRVHFWAM